MKMVPLIIKMGEYIFKHARPFRSVLFASTSAIPDQSKDATRDQKELEESDTLVDESKKEIT